MGSGRPKSRKKLSIMALEQRWMFDDAAVVDAAYAASALPSSAPSLTDSAAVPDTYPDAPSDPSPAQAALEAADNALVLDSPSPVQVSQRSGRKAVEFVDASVANCNARQLSVSMRSFVW